MFRALDVAATGMAAQEAKLDTVANNLANSNTTGYKRQDIEFEDLLYQNVRAPVPGPNGVAPVGTQLGSGVRVVATARSFGQGTIIQTDNPLDLAIEGSGMFQVMRPNGELGYTRAGTLKIDSTCKLVTSDGQPLEPPISIPADATSVNVSPDGAVSVLQPGNSTPNEVGRIELATFPNPAGLNALGHNLFQSTAASGDPITGTPGKEGRGTLQSKALEGSNVDVVTEMIGMIRTQRAYEMNSKVIAAADEMLRNATQLR